MPHSCPRLHEIEQASRVMPYLVSQGSVYLDMCKPQFQTKESIRWLVVSVQFIYLILFCNNRQPDKLPSLFCKHERLVGELLYYNSERM